MEAYFEVPIEYPFRPSRSCVVFIKPVPVAFDEESPLLAQTANPSALKLARKTVPYNNFLCELQDELNVFLPRVDRHASVEEVKRADLILSLQVKKVMFALELYAASETAQAEGGATLGAIFERHVRGRDRRVPMVYDAQRHVFEQR